MVRFKAKTHKIYDKALKKHELENQINLISTEIKEKYAKTSGDTSSKIFKVKFRETFTNSSGSFMISIKNLICFNLHSIVLTAALINVNAFSENCRTKEYLS